MRYTFTLFCLIFSFCVFSQSTYNQSLADSLKADDYGMKKYFYVLLKTGPAKIEDKAKLNELFKGHMQNISRLAKEGKLIIAGPFVDKEKGDNRGIFIIDMKSKEDVIKEMQVDPTVKEGIFKIEIIEWYGSAALPMYLPYHSQIEKKQP